MRLPEFVKLLLVSDPASLWEIGSRSAGSVAVPPARPARDLPKSEGRCSVVPEGRNESSLARSAGKRRKSRARPEGTAETLPAGVPMSPANPQSTTSGSSVSPRRIASFQRPTRHCVPGYVHWVPPGSIPSFLSEPRTVYIASRYVDPHTRAAGCADEASFRSTGTLGNQCKTK
jgi:hypothetical protein